MRRKEQIINPEALKSLSIISNLKTKSKKEELAYDHPGHMHEYIFNQSIPKFHWNILEGFMEGYLDPYGKYNPYLLLAPRSHGKTTLAEDYIAWRIGKTPLIKVQIITGKEDLAFARIDKIGKILEFNELFINLFGNLSTNGMEGFKWNAQRKDAFRELGGGQERDSTLTGFGIEGQPEGTRADLQFYDDIVTLENSQSETARENIQNKYEMSFRPILQPDGQEIFAGTRYHYSDFYGQLIQICDSVEKRYKDLWIDNPDGMVKRIEDFEKEKGDEVLEGVISHGS